MNYFYTGLFLIFSGGLLSINFPEKLKAQIVSLFSAIGMIFVLIPACNSIFNYITISKNINFPQPIGIVNFVIDPLSGFFILVISAMSFLGSLYAVGYMKPYLNKKMLTSSHFFFLSLLTCSMLLVVTVQNALFFLIVWEIMSLASFFLVIFENEKKEVVSAGINYLITMHISIIFLIAGFIMLSLKAESLDFAVFKPTNLIFIILFIGFGIKAGFVPFHTWLPKAHPAAPSHVSGIMSGVMIKTGIYGILRVLSMINIPSIEIACFVLFISAITGLFGILYATAQHDLKKLLAYSSIENIGIIGIGIGIGMLGLVYHNDLVAILGFSGGILHILNHSIFKELLFFSTGAVYNKTHTRNIEKLGGLIKKMPFTASLFLVGVIAILGLPPLNGFVSEFLIYLGMLHSVEINSYIVLIISVLAIATLALIGTMALLCFTKAFSVVFLGSPRSEKTEEVKDDVSKTMIFSMGILGVFILLIGLFPQYALILVINPALSLLKTHQLSYQQLIPVNVFKTISLVGFGFIVMFSIVFAVRTLLLKNKNISLSETWACGYIESNNRIQYTASSYVSPFLSFLKPFFIKKFDVSKPSELFPKSAYFKLTIHDFFEVRIINPIIRSVKGFFEHFYWIQSGSTQQYILYGLVFLIIALLGTIGVK